MTESRAMKNLDYLAAKHAQELVQCPDMENTVTKALGVLQDNGVYACFLYLLAKESDKGLKTAQQMIGLLQESQLTASEETQEKAEDILHYVNAYISSARLKKLLLIKDLLELMLIYSRYHAKTIEPIKNMEVSV